MSKLLRGSVLAGFVAILLLCGQVVRAQSADEDGSVTPSRLSVVEGPVYFWRPDMDDWSPAQLNTALATGDAVYAGDRGTAEIQVGPQDYVRLTSSTMVSVIAQEAGLLQFRVGSGTASFDLRSVQAGQMVEIDTPQGAVIVGRTGYYRIDIRGNATHLTVRRGGQATLVSEGNRNHSVSSNEEIVVIGGEGGGAVRVERRAAAEPDAWDRWNDARSDYYANARSLRYVPAGVYGAADLDQYGTWREYPTYGHVWVPAVSAGWAPYSAGHWQWDAFFGWTWVDTAPWGWATCHYGRWVLINGSWAWAPGPRVARPVYAPALVAFFQGGSGVSWVALGWGEPLIPWWGRPGFRGTAWWGGWGGPRLVNHRVHRSGPVDVGTIRFAHVGVPNAVISVRHEEFHRERVHSSRLPPPQARDLVPIGGVHPVRPMNASRGGETRPAQAAPVFRERPIAPVPTGPATPRSQPNMAPVPTSPAAAPTPIPAPAAQPPVMPRPQPAAGPSSVAPVAPSAPRSVPPMVPSARPESPPMRETQHRRERERGPDVVPVPPFAAPISAPAPIAPPPAIQRPQPVPAPMAAPAAPVAPPAAPAPSFQRPQPVPAPVPSAPVQRPPVTAPMPGMGPSMSGGGPGAFREREPERRHEERERPRPEMRGDPQRFQAPPQGAPGEPPGRMFRHRDQ